MALVIAPSLQSTHLPPSDFAAGRLSQRNLASAMDSATNGARISLPPISSLIDVPSNKDPIEQAPDLSPQSAHARKTSLPSPTHSHSQERRSLGGSPRNPPPATPPLPPPSSFDFPHHAAFNASPTSTSAPSSNYFAQGPSSTTSEGHSSRPSAYPPLPDSNHPAPRTSAYPPIPDAQSWPPQSSAQAPPAESPTQDQGRPSHSTYPDPTSHANYQPPPPPPPPPTHQRPLPTNFPPPYHGQQVPPIDPQMTPQWPPQYHSHPFPQQTPHPYTQGQGGYPCPSCNRSFSRPSSLRIHMNSHTGEKPFACQYPGCNKRFSVRSNRKRHERGCHERPNKDGSSNEKNGSDERHSPGGKYVI